MKDIKIAFFDIDGTLVDMGRKEISQKTLEMLRKLREREVLVNRRISGGWITGTRAM